MTGSVPAPTTSKPFARRTRVKLLRVNSDYSKPYPPDDDNKLWWDRLKAALVQRLRQRDPCADTKCLANAVRRHLGDERQMRCWPSSRGPSRGTRSRRH
jgi:hypothetical protein